MHKVMFFFLLMAAGNSFAADRFDYCAKVVNVKIAEIHPPIWIVGERGKKSEVKVMLPVDCRTRRPVVPADMQQALELLDLSLPLDFKVAITKGDYINPYFYGDYGASVEADLGRFYSKRWRLTKDLPLCGAVWEENEEYGDCFGIMLNLLRNRYVDEPGIP